MKIGKGRRAQSAGGSAGLKPGKPSKNQTKKEPIHSGNSGYYSTVDCMGIFHGKKSRRNSTSLYDIPSNL